MTSIIKLHAISGAMGESPPCYILQIDDFRFLLDCGWDEKFDMEYINELKKYKYKIDAILLSHSDTYHLGALPYLIGKCGFICPVYATVPIFKMGQMFMYDLHTSRNNSEEFDIFNLDDIDLAFEKILQLEYNRPVNLEGRGKGITITALPAGHSLGGSMWKISKAGNEDIYYAIDHNNKKERHLNGCETETIQNPGIFITNAFNALYVQEKRRQCDEKLMGVMQRTLLSGGNVLIATDTASRALELILMLDQMWKMKSSGLAPYSLVFLNNLAFNITEFAKAQIEWMGDKLRKSFESTNVNPFQLPNVQMCHDLTKLSQIPAPKVVVTSSADLECGFARDLFLQWCQDPRSSVVLTNRTSPGTLARQIMDNIIVRGQKIDLEVRQRVKLEGKELEEYQQEKRNERKRKMNRVEYEDSSDEEAEVNISVVVRKNGTIQHDLSIRPCDGLVTVNDSSFFRLNNNNHVSFPSDSPQKKRRFDDYGEVISHEDFKENQKRRNEVAPRSRRATLSTGSDKFDPEAPPTKCVAFTQKFSINCEVMFIDFEGRSDIEAVAKMITEMHPKKLVIVRGTAQSTNTLETLAQKLLPDVSIYKPTIGQVVDLSSSGQIVQIKLKDVSSLRFQNVRDIQVSWVEGNLIDDERDSEEVDPLRIGPGFEPLPPKEIPAHQPMVINRLRLNEFKKTLAKDGLESELKDGVLHCVCPNGVVYLQRDPKTKSIHIECDGLPEEYYKIRSLLYSQLAIL